MQGMLFLVVNQEGRPVNHGVIAEKITAEKYLCHFAANPPSARVCDIAEIQQWNLFPTDETLNTFIKALSKNEPPPPPPLPPVGESELVIDPEPTKPPAKKKKKKKRADKKPSKGNGHE